MTDSNHEHVETFGNPTEADLFSRLGGVADERQHEGAEKATESQQADTDDHPRVEWYEPPYPPRKLALTAEANSTVSRCATALSRGVCGFGFDLAPTDEDTESDPPTALTEFWHDGDFELGPDSLPATPSALFENSYYDRTLVGYGAVEILLNDELYVPTGAAHVPSHTIRRRQDKPGYVQLENGRPATFYGPPGGRADGVFVDVEGNVGNSAEAVGDLANEMLVNVEYSPLAPHYGIPPTVPSYATVVADGSAEEYQYRFFENDGVPRFAVIVEGGELTDRAWDQLEDKLKKLKGEEDAHRGILIEATGEAVAGPEQSVTIRIEPLQVGETEEAGFIDYRKENEHDIAQAFGVPPVVYGRTESVNYATAKQQVRQFAQSEVAPRQEQHAARLTKVIHQTYFDIDDWQFEWELHGGENLLRESETALNNSKASRGTYTVDELRTEVGLDPLDGDDGDTMLLELGKGGFNIGESGGGESTEAMFGGLENFEATVRRDERAENLGYDIATRADAD